ncbi:MAG: hypothetical protein AB7O52_05490 [Planctomycetota bacterium]
MSPHEFVRVDRESVPPAPLSPRGGLVAFSRCALLACGLAVGCATPQLQVAITPGSGVTLLAADELVLAAAGDASIWVTSASQVGLRYDWGGGSAPDFVLFYYRPAGSDVWLTGPGWIPHQAQPKWSPPAEGRWELRAVPMAGQVLAPIDATLPAQSIIVFDWTAPRIRIDRGLPIDTRGGGSVAGGARLPIEVRVDDEFLAERSILLELSAAEGGAWEPVASVPVGGLIEWQVPNRPMAGARLRVTARDLAGNVAWERVPGTLTVQSLQPETRVPSQHTVRRRPASIPYEVKSPGARVKRVELWVTEDGGASWRLAGYDHDVASPFELELADGHWGYQLVVEDEFGNRSAYPRPGDLPQAELLVDVTAPTVEWGTAEVVRAPATEAASEGRFELRVPYRVLDLAVDPTTFEFHFRPQNQPWRPILGTFAVDGELEFSIDALAPQPIELEARGVDVAGNVFHSSTLIYPNDILAPADLAFDEIPTGWRAAGEAVLIRYHADWSGSRPNSAALAFTFDGSTWHPLDDGLPNAGGFAWNLPRVSQASVRLRLTVSSDDGREVSHLAREAFGIDAHAPQARILGPRVGGGESVSLLFETHDEGGSGLARVELFARARGTARWTSIGHGTRDSGILEFTPPAPGGYDLWLVAVDGAGNRSRPAEEALPDELFAFTVEAESPGIELASFQHGGVYAGSSQHLIFLRWPADVPGSGIVDLQYSADDGGTWRPIARVAIGQERVAWTLPAEDIERCRVRALAQEVTGRRTSDQSRVPFQVDATPPDANLLAVEARDINTVAIQFEVHDRGPAGAAQVWLYHSRNEGSRWERWPEPFAVTEPMVLELEPDAYAFFIQAEDAVGNLAEAPVPGTAPQARLRLGKAEGLQFAILNPTGGVLAGGTRHYIFWRLDPATAEFTSLAVAIEARADGGPWRSIARDLPLQGSVPWFVPDDEGTQVELRAIAVDLQGQRYEARSPDPIYIDSSVPRVLFTGPVASNQRPAVVEYQLVHGDETSTTVELWLRAVSTPDWNRYAEARAGEPLAAEIPDGMYRVALVAVDAAGNRGQRPSRDSLGDADLLVDTVAPRLEVDGVGDRERLFHAQDWLVLRPRAVDRHLSAFPISFRYSIDGGESFRDLKRYHPNGDDFPWRLPEHVGMLVVEITAEDLAGNRARELIPLQVLPTPPRLLILTDPGQAVLASGQDLRVEWESRGVEPLHRGVTLELTTDGESWQVLARELPADGSFVWALPPLDSNRCQLRFTLTRPDGLSAETTTGVFTVSSTEPRARVEGVTPRTDQ